MLSGFQRGSPATILPSGRRRMMQASGRKTPAAKKDGGGDAELQEAEHGQKQRHDRQIQQDAGDAALGEKRFFVIPLPQPVGHIDPHDQHNDRHTDKYGGLQHFIRIGAALKDLEAEGQQVFKAEKLP